MLCRGLPALAAASLASAAPDGVTIDARYAVEVIAGDEARPVVSPTALAIDENGAIIVAETHRFRRGIDDNRDREYWFLQDIAAQSTADRLAMYERWAERVPMSYYTEFSEQLRIHEDTTGNGEIDRVRVLAGDFNDPLDGTAAGVFAFEGAVYFACIPKLWMLRDTTGDGLADERHSIADGFGVRVSFSGHDLNGFALGPCGRIYGTIGDRGFSVTTREGRRYHLPDQGAVFRFDPDGSNFEVIHTGLRNPKEIAFDALGNPVTVDNNADMGDRARIVYLTESGDSGWRMGHQTMHSFHRWIGLDVLPPNRWMAEEMWQPRRPGQPAFMIPPVALLTSGPSGLTHHPGTGFCESEAGRFLICDYRGGAAQSGIHSFRLDPDGAGFKLGDSRWFLRGIAATDVDYDWHGRVLVTDFIGGWSTHDGGRLLRITNQELPKAIAGHPPTADVVREGFASRPVAELVSLLAHPDMRVRLRAQIALTRADGGLDALATAATSTDAGFSTRLHGVWGLGIFARLGGPVPAPFPEIRPSADSAVRERAATILLGMADDADAKIRAQVWRVLGESPLMGDDLPIDRALADADPRVRYFAAFAAAKLGGYGHFDAVCRMLRENDDRDVFLRHAGVVALQALATEPCRLTDLSADASAALRLAATVALRRMRSLTVAGFLNDPDDRVAAEAIRAICDEDITETRPMVADLLDDAAGRQWPGFMQRRLVHNAYRLGGERNARRLIAVATNEARPMAVRTEALRLLEHWSQPHVADQFLGDHSPLPSRRPEEAAAAIGEAVDGMLETGGFLAEAALRLMESHNLDAAPETLAALAGNPSLPATARARALATLAANAPELAAPLLPALSIDTDEVLALAAIRALAASEPATAIARLGDAIDSSPATPLARAAWEILASIENDAADAWLARGIEALTRDHGIATDALERLAAARGRAESSPAIARALQDYQSFIDASDDPLAPWLAALRGGDPVSGEAVFKSHPAGECMRCHQADAGHAAGGEAGPNLAGLARRQDPRTILESLVLPDAKLSPGFGTASITLRHGDSLAGTIHEETAEHIDLVTPDGPLRVPVSEIRDITRAPSAMPAMGDKIDPHELRDLVAWLATLDGAPAAPPPGTPEAFTVYQPPADVPAPATADPAAFRRLGAQQYILCAACHGQQGEGTPAGPPLAGSEWVLGPAENLIRIQLRGLQGPIRVKGVEYNMVMPPMPYQNDEQIAAVLTHIRSSFGNDAPAVAPAEVGKFRDEVGKPMLTADDLAPHGK